MLDEIVGNYDFILHGGAIAFTEKKDTKIKYGCESKEAAIAAVTRRDLRVYEETLSPGRTLDAHTSSTNLSPRLMEVSINDSHLVTQQREQTYGAEKANEGWSDADPWRTKRLRCRKENARH